MFPLRDSETHVTSDILFSLTWEPFSAVEVPSMGISTDRQPHSEADICCCVHWCQSNLSRLTLGPHHIRNHKSGRHTTLISHWIIWVSSR